MIFFDFIFDNEATKVMLFPDYCYPFFKHGATETGRKCLFLGASVF